MVRDIERGYKTVIPQEYRDAIESAVEISVKSGIKIYLIGGIVRDIILKNVIKDVDITVEGDAIEFVTKLEQFSEFKIISIQENLRTVKARYKNGIIIDFASTREEYYKMGGVLPVAHNFGCNIKQDVKRRDFTINTLALGLVGDERYKLIDYYDGYKDILNKKIKILHEKSFMDDPSRIVRAVKFQMRFNFDIEENTEILMRKYLQNVDKTIPLERIKNELKQYFRINKPNLYSNIIQKEVYKLISNNPEKIFDEYLFSKIKKYIENNDIWIIYLAMLIINTENENTRLNLTSEEKDSIKEAKELLNDNNIEIEDNFKIYKAFSKKSNAAIFIYYIITKNSAVIKYITALKQIKISVNGKDLINLGYKPSKMFSKIFDNILKNKLEGKLKTKEEEIEFIKNSNYIK